MSETTHLICAHCGAANPVSNEVGTDVLHIEFPFSANRAVVLFTCKQCEASYTLFSQRECAKFQESHQEEAKAKLLDLLNDPDFSLSCSERD